MRQRLFTDLCSCINLFPLLVSVMAAMALWQVSIPSYLWPIRRGPILRGETPLKELLQRALSLYEIYIGSSIQYGTTYLLTQCNTVNRYKMPTTQYIRVPSADLLGPDGSHGLV